VFRALLLISLFSACFGGGDCGYYGGFVPGTYLSTGGAWYTGSGTFAHAQAGAKTLVLDTDPAGQPRARITYQRDGKPVVEVWAIGPSGSGQSFPWATPPPVPLTRLAWLPSSQDFGSVPLGAKANFVFTLHNASGPSATHITLPLPEGSAFTWTSTCNSLAPDQTCIVDVTFTPTSTEVVSAQIVASALNVSPVTATVTGRGVRVQDAGAD
jgi:hypothetical protein